MDNQDTSQEQKEIQRLKQSLSRLTQVESAYRSVVDHVVDGIVGSGANVKTAS